MVGARGLSCDHEDDQSEKGVRTVNTVDINTFVSPHVYNGNSTKWRLKREKTEFCPIPVIIRQYYLNYYNYITFSIFC